MELVWRTHRRVYRATGGRLGRSFAGMPVGLLTVTGRRSGRPRTATLPYLRDGDAHVLVASNAGEPTDPDWVLNLRANPEATYQLGRTIVRVRAREADGEERDRLWALATGANPDYREYERRTQRRLPVVVLEPAGS